MGRGVVIADCDHPSVEIERSVFTAAELPMTLAQCRTESEVIAAGQGASALLVQYAPVTRAVLTALPQCRVVGRYGVGLDTIDVAAAAELGVAVVNVPDYCVVEVANHAIALILALTRGIVALDRGIQGGVWDFRLGGELRRPLEQRLGLVGIGRIGEAVATRARTLGYEVVATDPRPRRVGDVPLVSMDELLSTSDIVSVHSWLDASTYHLIGERAFERMKPGALLVNTARGRIVDEAALVGALRSGRLGGAALDVLEQEPIAADSALVGLPNVILTPHAAFYSRESLVEMKRRVAEKIVAGLVATAERAPHMPVG